MLKAYIVEIEYDEAEIVFEENEPDDERYTRAPQFDEYWRSRRIPLQKLFAEGWNYECWHCYKLVDEEGWDYEEDRPINYKIIDNQVLCSDKCVCAYQKHKITRKQIKAFILNYWPKAWPIWIYPRNGTASFGFGGSATAGWNMTDPTFVTIRKCDREIWEAWKNSDRAPQRP